MSRAGYSDDGDALVLWRNAVESALRGKRGQQFLQALLTSLDALSVPRLIADDLVAGGECCALGAVALKCGIDIRDLDANGSSAVVKRFGIARALAAEIAYVNDELGPDDETPEQRFRRVREWTVANLRALEDT